MDILMSFMPYLVSILVAIISGIFSYLQATKNTKQQVDIVIQNNKHEIEKLMEQHKIDLESLNEKHKLEMEKIDKEHKLELERIEKDHEHEKEILELKSETAINEQGQMAMNNVLADIMGNVFNGMLAGDIKPEDLDNLSKKTEKK